MKQVIRTTEVIGVSKDAYQYLARISRTQRGCKPLDEQQEERIWKRLIKNKDGLKELNNDSLGGGDGTYNGRWWGWNVETLRKMLKDGGYTWKEYGEQEIIELYI